MSTVTIPSSNPPPYPVRRFTVAEYHRLIQTGMLTEDDPVELLEGWIVPKMPRNPVHDATIAIVSELLRVLMPKGWHVRIQSAITTDDSEPEPDLVVTRGVSRDYLSRHPGPADIALVVEVADSSLERDREAKARLYARAGIPAYWVVNLSDLRVESYSDPDASTGYRKHLEFGLGQSIPLVIAGETRTVPIRELLP
jgi:Uma2 family endonuclease